jgi:hypothetical protein
MTDEEIIRWFRSADPSTSRPQSYSELASKKIPQFIMEDMDRAYISGVMDCADMFLSMYRKGYVRATETHNVLMACLHNARHNGWRLLQDEHEAIMAWTRLRKKVIARCNDKCTMCGSGENLEVHHIVSVADGGTMNMNNLTTVCFACHRERKNEATDKNPAIHHKRGA